MFDFPIALRVASRRDLTPSVVEFTLARADGAALPPFTAGAHLTLRTPSGAMRRYSLVNEGTAPTEYVIAVKRERESRGGSRSMHDEALPGVTLEVTELENSFALTEAPDYLLVAGGIGITPLYAMAQELERRGKSFTLIYCTRSAEETAYREDLTQAFGTGVHFHHDQGDPAQVYDFWDHFAEPRPQHVFCCGPKPLMEEIAALTGHWPEGRVHFEEFRPVEIVRATDQAFEVELKRSGRVVNVPADRSILEALRDAGERTVSSCESGTCGTCKTRLLAGDADHRDMVLMDEEKPSHIMICVSRSQGGRLVLDL